MKKMILLVVLMMVVVGCEETHKSVFKPINNPQFVKEYGDTESMRTAYNLLIVDRFYAQKIADMNERITKIESQLDPNDPDSGKQ